MNIFGVGLPEMILILAVGLLVFGPKRLPEIGRSVARTLKSLQDVSKDFETELKREIDKPTETVSSTNTATTTKTADALPKAEEITTADSEDTEAAEDLATSEADGEIRETDVVEEVEEGNSLEGEEAIAVESPKPETTTDTTAASTTTEHPPETADVPPEEPTV